MSKTVTIEIPLLVGSNGKWCASGYSSTAKDGADWSFMSDCLGDDPSVERRYMVRATVTVPDDAPEVVAGTVEASS